MAALMIGFATLAGRFEFLKRRFFGGVVEALDPGQNFRLGLLREKGSKKKGSGIEMLVYIQNSGQ